MAEISGFGFIDPEDTPDPHPENIGLGEVTCRCGGVWFSLKGTGVIAGRIGCSTCGEFSEVLVVEKLSTPAESPLGPTEEERHE